MTDEGEIDGRRQTLGQASSTGPGRDGGRSEGPKPTDRTRYESDDRIDAVSRLLSAKRAAFDRPPVQLTMPDTSGMLGAIASRLKTFPVPSAGIGQALAPLELPRPRILDGGPDHEPSPLDLPRDQSDAVRPSSDRPSTRINAGGGPIPSRRDSTPPSPPVTMPIEANGGLLMASSPSEQGKVSGPRLASILSRSFADRGPADQPPTVDDRRHPETGPSVAFAGDRGPAPITGQGPHDDRSVTSIGPGTASVALPGEPRRSTISPRDFQRPLAAQTAWPANSGVLSSHQSVPAIDAGRSANFVRNPLSDGIKNFSMASSSSGEGERRPSLSSSISMSSDEHAFGSPGASRGGAPIDLTKTNDLLQQLVDAAKKQRASPLPAGGPSVYPVR